MQDMPDFPDIEEKLRPTWKTRFLVAFNSAWCPAFLVYYGIALRDSVAKYDVGWGEFSVFLVIAICTAAVLAVMIGYLYRQESWINYWQRNSWELLRDKDAMLRVMLTRELELQLLKQRLAGLTSEQPSQERLN